MNTKAIPWIILGGVLIIGAAVWTLNRGDDPMIENETMVQSTEESQAIENEEARPADPSSVEDPVMRPDTTRDDGTPEEMTAQESGAYAEYSAETVAAEQAKGNTVVLFFHADWCPYCRAADAAFKANVSEIPAGVTLLKTDYDSEKELKTQYGVTTQHTFVQLDSEGKAVTKWVSGDTAALKANLK